MTDTVKVEQWSYPFKVKGGEGQPSKAVTNPQQYYDALAKAESGYYPIGRNGLWHGGVHFDKGTANLLDQTAVHCIADGEVIAYRIDSRYPTATFSSGVKTYSKGFVLVRHRLEAPKPPALAGTVTPATPPAPQPSLIFYSLYMHLLDWDGYGNPGAPTPPDFFGETVYSVKPEKAIDPTIGLRVREGPASTFAVRALLPKGTKVRLGDVGGPTHNWRKLVSILEGSVLPSLTLDDNCWVFPGEMESTVNPDEFLVGEKANDPEPTLAPGKGFNVRKTGNGQANDPKTGLIPVGTTFTLEPGTGNRRKLKAFVSGQDITPLSANSVQNIRGFVYVPDLQTSRTEPKKDEVFVLERPYAIKAGALVGHPGCYQNHDDAVASPLVHLEIFCCEDLPAFIAKSKAATLGLPAEQKTLLKVYKGASKLIAHRADISASNPPKVTDAGTVVGVDMILSLGQLDNLPADRKITASETVPGSTTPKITQWWRLDGFFADVNGNPIGGWLTEQSEITTRHSPWEWEGFDFISETVCNADNLACHLDMTGTLDESERADYSARIDLADNGPVKTRLYDIIDGADGSIRDNKLTPQEISAALAKPWHAQSIARLATHYESEWLWKEDKWNELDTLMAPDGEPNANWVEEKRRIKELAWWKVLADKGLLEGAGNVWHTNLIGLLSNFIKIRTCKCNATVKVTKWESQSSGNTYYGPVHWGTKRLSQAPQWHDLVASGQVTADEKEIICVMTENEGKIEAVQSYDSEIITAGAMQKTINIAGKGEFPTQVKRFKDQHSNLYFDLFESQGWHLDSTSETPKMFYQHADWENGIKLEGQALKNSLRNGCEESTFGDKIDCPLVSSIACAISSPEYVQIQIMDYIQRLRNALAKKPTGYTYSASELFKTKLGKALVLDQDINRPGNVKDDLKAAIDKFHTDHPTASQDIGTWGTAHANYEQTIIENYGPERRMTEPSQRYEKLKQEL
jgi:hypothetical protein